MFKLNITPKSQPQEILLTFLYMCYLVFVLASIMLFNQVIELNFFTMKIEITGGVIPYVFLYPISFIVLRIYSYENVNRMMISMILASLVYILICKLVIDLPHSATMNKSNELMTILSSSFKMYLGGLIAMPAGIYSSFITLNLLSRININFNFISLSIATIVGEIVNTIIVFPIGFHGVFDLKTIFNTIIVDALIFKLVFGIILAAICMLIINLIIKVKVD